MAAKPGFKTTEFWSGKLIQLGALVAAVSGQLSPKYAALAALVVEGCYALSRGITKAGSLSKEDAVAIAKAELEKYGQPPVS